MSPLSVSLRRTDVYALKRVRHHGSTAPPQRCPRQELLGQNGPPAFASPQSKWPLLHSLRTSEPVGPREKVEMTVQCQNRANCAGVYRCQIRTYDEKMRGSTEALTAEKTSESLLLTTNVCLVLVKVDLVQADIGAAKWLALAQSSLNQGDPPCQSPAWPRRVAGSDRFWLRELRDSQHFSTFYGPSVQAMDTQLGPRHRRRTPTIHRGRAQRRICAGSLHLTRPSVRGRQIAGNSASSTKPVAGGTWLTNRRESLDGGLEVPESRVVATIQGATLVNFPSRR